MFSDTFAGIAPSSATGFIAAQTLGAILAPAAIAWWFPHPAPAPAATSPQQEMPAR
jgi:arsenate reductase